MQRSSWMLPLLYLAHHARAAPTPHIRSKDNPPLVLVNGLAGAILKGKWTDVHEPHFWCSKTSKGYETLWLNLEQVVPFQKDCLMNRLVLHYDPTIGAYSNTSGVDVDSNVDWGGVGGLAYLDPSLGPAKKATGYFADLIDALTGAGYQIGKNLRGAPYDWRLASDGHAVPFQYYDKLRALIEDTVAANGGARVWLVAHSLGCPTTSAFLRRQASDWLTDNVAGFVALAGVWGGAAKMALALVSGDNMGAPVPHDYVRPVQRSAASGVWMLPGREFSAPGAAPIIITPSQNFSSNASDMYQLMGVLNLTQGQSIFKKLGASGELLDKLPRPPVRTAVFYGSGVKTGRSYVFDAPLDHAGTPTPSATLYGDGDGTVNLESALLPVRRWNASKPLGVGAPEVTFREFAGVSHFGMVSDEKVRAALFDVLGIVGESSED